MKKLILTLLLIVWASSVIAAGTIVQTYEEVDKRGKHWIQVTAVCTADSADGTYPDDQIGIDVSGTYLMQIKTQPSGGVAPTDNSEIELNENVASTGDDVLNGAGTDRIDNAADNDFQPTIDGAPSAVPIYGPLYYNITQQGGATNSAVVTIILDFIQ
jgi:hypothetical protein